MMVCENLDGDSACLKAFALTCKTICEWALTIHSVSMMIDLSSGNTQVIWKVVSHLLTQANDTTVQVPQVVIQNTGDAFADRVIKLASNFKTLKLRLINNHGIQHSILTSLYTQCMSLVSAVEPPTMYGAQSWGLKFTRGRTNDLLRFLLRVTRHLHTLEMEGSLYWIGQTDVNDMCPVLHTLRLVDIVNPSIPRSCCHFIRLPTLRRLELVRMEVTSTTLRHIGTNRHVVSLHFVDCVVTKSALTKAVRACRQLVTFEYTLNTTLWSELPSVEKEYDIAELLYQFSKHHKYTLKHLTILSMQAKVRDRCHYADELSQLSVLKTLAVNHEHLHPRYFDTHTHPQCEARRNQQKGYMYPTNPTQPSELILSLPRSLQRLELHVCREIPLTVTLLNVLHHLVIKRQTEPLGWFWPSGLRCIKVTFEQSRLTQHERNQLATLSAHLGGFNYQQATSSSKLCATSPRCIWEARQTVCHGTSPARWRY